MRFRIPAILALLALTGCVNSFFFLPTRTVYRTAESLPGEVQDVHFQSADGTHLHGWFFPAPGTARGTVIHFHGNAQNLTAHSAYMDWIPSQGFNLFEFDYRGYGQSEGRPNRSGMVEDSVAALRYIRARRDVDPNRIVVFGQSLGAAAALAALSKDGFDQVKAVALDSPFYSYRSIVRDKIRQIPGLSWLRWPLSFAVVSNGKSPAAYIAHVSPTPLLILHGTDDAVVPFHHSQWLDEKAGDPHRLVPVEGGQHTDALIRHADVYRPLLVKFFTDSLESSP